MITLQYTGTNTTLLNAVAKANEILSGDAFYEKISALPQTANAPGPTFSEVAQLLKDSDCVITVQTYRNPFGKIAKNNTPFMFCVNLSKLSSVTAFAVHTLIHQTTLSIDMRDKKLQKLKVSKRTYSEDESLPWKIGEIAEIISRKAKRFA